MQITEVNVTPINNEKKLKGFASIVFDNCFIVSDIKIIETARGAFLSMPSKKAANGKFRDVAHPLNGETRKMIEERVFETYENVTGRRLGSDFAVQDVETENSPEPMEQKPVSSEAVSEGEESAREEKTEEKSVDTSTLLSVKEFGY
ncbi:MAG: hypothetical protein GXO69_04410 [Acidobacteria bacterium]|nr:hypothetical protein [Acidobacteriota bacterium]